MVTAEVYHCGRHEGDRSSPHRVASAATGDDYYLVMTLPALNPTAANRRANLTFLVNTMDDGNASKFGLRVGKDRRQVSAWMTGRKSIADHTAREIEVACGKPRGWLDREHAGSSQLVHQDSRMESQSQRTDPDKMRDAMTLLRHLADLRDVPELVHDPVALAIALDFVVEFDTPLTNDNVLDITKRLAAKLRGDGNATQERGAVA